MSSKKMPKPPRSSEPADEEPARSTLGSSLENHIENHVLAVIEQVFSDETFLQWLEETGKDKSTIMQKVLDSPALIGKASPKKSTAPSVSIKVLDKTISNFDDGYKSGGCLMSIGYRATEGKDPFTLCGVTAKSGVCPACQKKASGKNLLKEFAKKGFSVSIYRKNNAATAQRWAINKKKTMGKEGANDRLRTLADSSSASEEEPAQPLVDVEDWIIYEHNGDLDFHQNYGLVAEVSGNDRTVIGIDFNLDNKMRKLTQAEASKFEGLGFVLSEQAVEAEEEKQPKSSSSKRPARSDTSAQDSA